MYLLVPLASTHFPQTNSYQGIIITDRATTYYLFTYTCGDIQWSSIGSEAPVVGYNAQADYFFNHPASGYDSIGEAVSCPSSSKFMQQSGQPNTEGDEVGSNPSLQAASVECVAFYDLDVMDIMDDILQEIIQEVEACPSCSTQARQDSRFQRQPGTTNCYTQVAPVTHSRLPRPFTFVQQFCYDLRTTYVSLWDTFTHMYNIHND